MRKLIGFLGSIGIGLLLAAAGLALDVATLTYAGVSILALMAALWLGAWAKPTVVTVTAPAPRLPSEPEPDPRELDEKGLALLSLRRGRDSAVVALSQKGDEGARRAYHEIHAAMLSVKRHFGIGPLKITSKTHDRVPYKLVLEAYVDFIDRIYPLLREGHVDEARAMKFHWSWGED